MNRGRIQAQGNGTEKSEPWATLSDITKDIGINKVTNLEQQLTPAELSQRQIALQQVRNRINTTPYCGISALYKKSYWNDFRQRQIRIDIEVLNGIAFIN